MTEMFTLDLLREERIGLDEAIYCASKSVDQIGAILACAAEIGTRLLLTRLDAGQFAALPQHLRKCLDYEPLSRTAILGEPSPRRAGPAVAVVMAGTSDLVAGREAARTLAYNGQAYAEFVDVGVAGLWRLMERLEEIRQCPVVIIAAGMDAALVSVLGGLLSGAVIALPTSVGYGVAAGGTSALHAALASCAPGVTVVNIDNGYGAACAALRIMNLGTFEEADEAVGEGATAEREQVMR